MTITRPVTKPALTEEEDTWRFNLERERGKPIVATWFRVLVQKDIDGKVTDITQRAVPVTRIAAQLVGKSVTLASGKVITGPNLVEAIEMFGDLFAAEDAAGP